MWRVWPLVVPCFACSFVTSLYAAGVRLRGRAGPMTFHRRYQHRMTRPPQMWLPGWLCFVILAGGPTLAGGKFLTPRRRQSRHRIHLLSDVERGLWRAVLLEGHLAPCNAPTTVRACTHAVASHELDNDVHVPEYTSRNTRDDRM
jgi:hypothetical protein